MNVLLEWIGQTALVMTGLIPLAWGLSALLRRIGEARLAYAGWLLVLPALLPPGAWSILPATRPVLASGEPIRAMVPPMTVMAGTTTFPWLVMIWLAGALGLAGAALFRQWQFHRRLCRHAVSHDAVDAGWAALRTQTAIPKWLRIRHSTACPGPLVTGILRPTLHLPASLPAGFDQHGELVLAHEAAHIRHGDTLWNAVLLLVRSLFWFHPLVHLASARLRQDQELAADESVTVRSNRDKTLAYARLLCRSGGLESRHLGVAWIARGSLRERMIMIAKKEPTRTTHALALIALLLAFGMTTVAVADPPAQSGTATNTDEVIMEVDPDRHHEDSLKPIERIEPEWPREALIRGISGEVKLVGTVTADTSLSDIEIVHSEPEGVFDDVAMEAFSQWRFRPVTPAGEPPTPDNVVPARVEQTIHFEIEYKFERRNGD